MGFLGQEANSVARFLPAKQICSEWENTKYKYKIQNINTNTNTNTGRKFSCKNLARQANLLRVAKPSRVWLSAAFCIHRHSKAFLTAFPAQKDCIGTSITLLHHGSSAIHAHFWGKKRWETFANSSYVSLHSEIITRVQRNHFEETCSSKLPPSWS